MWYCSSWGITAGHYCVSSYNASCCSDDANWVLIENFKLMHLSARRDVVLPPVDTPPGNDDSGGSQSPGLGVTDIVTIALAAAAVFVALAAWLRPNVKLGKPSWWRAKTRVTRLPRPKWWIQAQRFGREVDDTTTSASNSITASGGENNNGLNATTDGGDEAVDEAIENRISSRISAEEAAVWGDL